jgi:hypothetical protein
MAQFTALPALVNNQRFLAARAWMCAGEFSIIPHPSKFVNRKIAQKLKKYFSHFRHFDYCFFYWQVVYYVMSGGEENRKTKKT